MREWRIIEALDGTDVPHTDGRRRLRRHRRCSAAPSTSWASSTAGRRWATDGLARAVRHRPGGPPRPGLPARRGHRPAVQGRLAGQGPGTTSAGPTASTSARSSAGPASSSGSRVASCPASTRPRPGCAPTRRSTSSPGLMHGDYQFANVMYRHGAPAQLAAIVDWEMGTVGDPKLDLAWVVQSWPEDTSAAEAPVGELRRHARHAVARPRCSSTTPRCPAGRSTTSTTT